MAMYPMGFSFLKNFHSFCDASVAGPSGLAVLPPPLS